MLLGEDFDKILNKWENCYNPLEMDNITIIKKLINIIKEYLDEEEKSINDQIIDLYIIGNNIPLTHLSNEIMRTCIESIDVTNIIKSIEH